MNKEPEEEECYCEMDGEDKVICKPCRVKFYGEDPEPPTLNTHPESEEESW